MKTLSVNILFKNKTDLLKFYLFFHKDITFNSNVLKKYKKKKIKKSGFTILKSPHVNKKAQDQFENRFFKKEIFLYNLKVFKYLIFLKKISFSLFSNVHLKIKQTLGYKYFKKVGLTIFNLNNVKVCKYNSFKVSNLNKLKQVKNKKLKRITLKKANNFLKIFDLYGEVLGFSLNSSVGRAKG